MQYKVLSQDDLSELVTIDDFMDFAKVTDLYDEPTVLQCVSSATELVQKWIDGFVIPTKVIVEDEIKSNIVYLPFSPVHDVSDVKILIDFNNEINLTPSDYRFSDVSCTLALNPALVKNIYGKQIQFEMYCGYKDLPYVIKHAIMQTANTMYSFREDGYIAQLHKVPIDVARMLHPYRNRPSY